MNEYAFAFIVQARPCPTFGRPVHLRGSPHRLQPGTSPHALRIPPRDGHPALRELRSGGSRSALVCFRLSPSCPFRPLHTFHSSRPARHYPRFWIQRSSFERRRDWNPPDQRAAQRTLRPLLTSALRSGCLSSPPVVFPRQQAQISWGNSSRLPCAIARSTPLASMDMDFAMQSLLVRHSGRLKSDSCTSTRMFVPRFFWTPSRVEALALH